MLSALLCAVLAAPPVCEGQIHFRWPSSSFAGQRGDIASDVVIDARTNWQFELRDRSLKQVLIRF